MSKTLLELKNLWKKYPVYGPLGKLAGPRTHMSAVADLSLVPDLDGDHVGRRLHAARDAERRG